jgi:predicted MPP superfamily phosphohydrolase
MRRYGWLVPAAMLAALVTYTGLQVALALPARQGLAWSACALLFSGLLGWQFTYRDRRVPTEARWFRAFTWATWISLGAWSTFFFFTASSDLLRLAWAAVSRALGGPGTMGTFTAGPILALLGASAGLSALGLGEALSGPRVREVRVPIPGLAPALEGLRVVQISDLHVGPTIRRRHVERVVSRALAARPDLIAVTGDLADGPPAALAAHTAPLARLRAPLGVFYVTGNHEYYWGARGWIERARALGMTPLVDENRVVAHRGAKILVGGVADRSGPGFVPSHRSDPLRAAATDEAVVLKILLAHRPDSCEEAEAAGFDLQLSGHTHGGQFFPWSLLIRLFHRYARGLHRHGRLSLYVTPGAGYWGPPHRFGVPSEVPVLILERERP